ncbi:hypothetical protein CINS5918_06745 [Campylobacter insulaenigrae]|uniref:hypothetical protein n=1 Tax=Campylobacter insulaenigrae TaxID=260714 RepID=UPI0021531519|nr:hypothetical protein [Campylobacter insulaenigrae]MCR6582163.1 hypothetical protein [Campylobacter insulaenigrae]
MQENLFDKNINALKDKRLKEKLQNFNERKFQVQIGDDSLDINFIKENYGGGIIKFMMMLFLICMKKLRHMMINIFYILYFIFMVLEMEFYTKCYYKTNTIKK